MITSWNGARLYQVIIGQQTRSSLQRTGQLFLNSGQHQRYLSSDGGDKEDDKSNPASKTDDAASSQKPGRGRKSRPHEQSGDRVVAKSKLNDLLQSIVKDQKQRKTTSESQLKPGANQINFKLARKESVRMTEEEIEAADQERTNVKEIGKEMLTAAKNVAKSLPGDAQVIESELVKKLRTSSSSKVNLGDLFQGMKVDKTPGPDKPPSGREQSNDFSRAGRVRNDMRERTGAPQQRSETGRPGRGSRMARSAEEVSGLSYRPIDIFGTKPLGIFTKSKGEPSSAPISYLKTWDALHAKELKLSVTHPPANGLEEMILWTEQGKLWHFPIDNEQGLDAEAKVSFTDHIFLEPHLDPWCPAKGPIRHFMELVCVGLSKNPYLTVTEKKNQIEWYHQYFKNKANLIKDLGAGEIK